MTLNEIVEKLIELMRQDQENVLIFKKFLKGINTNERNQEEIYDILKNLKIKVELDL